VIGRPGAMRAVRVRRLREGTLAPARDRLAVEEPLEIRLTWASPEEIATTDTVSVTMRTPGDDFDLVAGFLFGEGVLDDAAAIRDIRYCSGDEPQAYNVVEARLRPGVTVDPARYRRNFYASSSCGVCGKASLEAVEVLGCDVLPAGDPAVESSLIVELPTLLHQAQKTFHQTGGLHAAGLFTRDGTPDVVREDVGRHNAVDKAVGSLFLAGGLGEEGHVLVVSGRASFEIIQKALRARVPLVVAVGAPSTLAVDLATRFNQTLIGFARGGRFNVYSGAERVL
jgi:FdhD protein